MTESSGANESRLPGYDPLFEAVFRQQDEQVRRIAAMHFRKPGRLARLLWMLERARADWVAMALWTMIVIGLVGGAAILLANLPLTGGGDYRDIVLACATVVALGVFVLAAVTTPLMRVVDVGPGFGTAILRRPGPWLAGGFIGPVTAALFLLASVRPDREAAMGAALVTAGTYSLLWAVSRQVVGLTDSLALGDLLASHVKSTMRRMTKLAERAGRRMFKASLPDEVAILEINSQQVAVATGPVNQAVAGVIRCIALGRSYEALALWQGLIEAVEEFAEEVEGAVGTDPGLVQIIAEALPLVCAGFDATGNRLEAHRSVILAARFASLPYVHPHAGAARQRTLMALNSLLEAYWLDDHSQVPAGIADSLGKQFAAQVRVRAFDDADTTLRMVFETLEKSNKSGRLHIEEVASKAAIECLAQALLVSNPAMREHFMDHWTSLVVRHGVPSIATYRFIPFDPGRRFVPGFDLQGGDLQTLLTSVPSDEALVAVSKVVEDLFRRLVPGLFAVGAESPRFQGATDLLSLLLAMLLRLVASSSETVERRQLAGEAIEMVLDGLERQSEGQRLKLLTDDDFVEMLWSCVLAAGSLMDSQEQVRLWTTRISKWLPQREALSSAYLRRFAVGVLLAADVPDEEVVSRTQRDASNDRWGDFDSGLHIGPVGRVNRCNRNRTKHVPGAPEYVDAWAATTFPRFA